MTTLVLGCNGQLGEALEDTIPVATEMVGRDLPDLDITDQKALRGLCEDIRPTVIINAAAYTAVDAAETETAIAMAVNTDGPANIAAVAKEIGARVIHISTDFVFDGNANTPYSPQTTPSPLSVYGKTKYDGEQAVLSTLPDSSFIIRTAWLYSITGNNFVKTMLRLMSERDELSVVADQRGTPTWANSLAEAVWAASMATDVAGIFHWTDDGESTSHEFAVAIQEEALKMGLLDKKIPVHAIGSEEYPTPAHRPAYSVLDCTSTREALQLQPARWRDNLREMLASM